MLEVKFVTESSRKSSILNQSGRRDFVFLLINFMDEKAYLNFYVVSKQHTYNFERIFLFWELFTW